jgi:hypothetical protein
MAFSDGRNTGISACAPSGVALRCRWKSVRVVIYMEQRVTNPLGAQVGGLCSGSEIRHLFQVADSAELALLLN